MLASAIRTMIWMMILTTCRHFNIILNRYKFKMSSTRSELVKHRFSTFVNYCFFFIFSVPQEDRWRHRQGHRRLEGSEDHCLPDHPEPTGCHLGCPIGCLPDREGPEGTATRSQEGQEHQAQWQHHLRWSDQHCPGDATPLDGPRTVRYLQGSAGYGPQRWLHDRWPCATWCHWRHQQWSDRMSCWVNVKIYTEL